MDLEQEKHTGAKAAPQARAGLSDKAIASVFISGATLITALRAPLYLGFTPQPVLTLALDIVAIGVLWLGTLRRSRTLYLVAGSLLLALLTLKMATQPAALGLPMAVVWPLRLVVVMIVGACWALLAGPAAWLRRSIVGVGAASLLILLIWGGPAVGSAVFGWNVVSPATNFMPYQLAVDSQGTVYASDFNGGLVWVFNSSGAPAGTIHPASAPLPATPGPGILLNGMEDEIVRSGASAAPTVGPGPANIDPEAVGALPGLCGIAVDAQDNLYTLALNSAPPFYIAKFDRDGMITARFALPDDFTPWLGCLAVDQDHIFASAQGGKIYIMDLQGVVQRQAQVFFKPLGIAASGGKLLALASNSLAAVDVNSGALESGVLKADLGQTFTNIASAPNNEVVIADGATSRILRFNPATRQVVGYVGGVGDTPGQFGSVGGMAFDQEGRLFVADMKHRVIQRFDSAGSVDAIWWAARNLPVSNGQNASGTVR